MKLIIQMLFVFSSLFIYTSCSDDDDSQNPVSGVGSASFQISGNLEGDLTGIADFKSLESAGIHTWNINIRDLDPITFSISIGQTGSEPIARPATGTYTLGIGSANQSDDVYLTTYTHYGESQASQEYYTVGMAETSGEMVITSSTNDLIEGTFEFNAARTDNDGNTQTINVSQGVFNAVPGR